MTIDQAIKKAIEGGYKCPVNTNYFIFTKAGKDELPRLFLDPLFWQSLGLVLGWQTENSSHQPCGIGWIYYWHRFVDALSEGKSAEDFFKEL